jgi:hypothetical protein
MTMAIGTPNYGGKKKNNWRIKEGSNIYRILPPLGKFANEGKWATFEKLHWGYKGSKGMRPFSCIEVKDFKTKMVKVQCPECDLIAQKKSQLEQYTNKLKAEGKSEADIKDFVKPITDWLMAHNLDKKWYVNAMAADNQIGRLAIPHKSYEQLQLVLNDLTQKQGVDPIGVDGGVYFDFERTGSGNQTSHRVTVVQEAQKIDIGNGKTATAMVVKPAPLTADMIARLAAEAYDLKDSFRRLTFDEIKRLVTSNGDPDIVDSVFASPEAQNAINNMNGVDNDEPESALPASLPAMTLPAAPMPVTSIQNLAPTPLPAPSPAATVAPAMLPPQTPAAVDDTIAQLQAQLAALQAKAAPAATAKSMSDADFVAAFGFSKK